MRHRLAAWCAELAPALLFAAFYAGALVLGSVRGRRSLWLAVLGAPAGTGVVLVGLVLSAGVAHGSGGVNSEKDSKSRKETGQGSPEPDSSRHGEAYAGSRDDQKTVAPKAQPSAGRRGNGGTRGLFAAAAAAGATGRAAFALARKLFGLLRVRTAQRQRRRRFFTRRPREVEPRVGARPAAARFFALATLRAELTPPLVFAACYVGALALGSAWVRQRLWLAAVGAPGVVGVVLLGLLGICIEGSRRGWSLSRLYAACWTRLRGTPLPPRSSYWFRWQAARRRRWLRRRASVRGPPLGAFVGSSERTSAFAGSCALFAALGALPLLRRCWQLLARVEWAALSGLCWTCRAVVATPAFVTWASWALWAPRNAKST